jgi:ssDNA-binding Zn-finger/Zn-ribbon topoisomerase 1
MMNQTATLVIDDCENWPDCQNTAYRIVHKWPSSIYNPSTGAFHDALCDIARSVTYCERCRKERDIEMSKARWLRFARSNVQTSQPKEPNTNPERPTIEHLKTQLADIIALPVPERTT